MLDKTREPHILQLETKEKFFEISIFFGNFPYGVLYARKTSGFEKSRVGVNKSTLEKPHSSESTMEANKIQISKCQKIKKRTF